ncbi:mevalonate kinase [Stipitochalara longipes BDJ]|nr:mevalonate kinase [Stipitochalara longipes BDJ]
MAPTFMVSAPGKVIVFSEYATVYGKPAIAAAISLRSYLLVTTLSKSQRTVKLNFRDIGLSHIWKIDTLPWDIFNQSSKKSFYYSIVNTLDPELLDAIMPHTDLCRRIFQRNSERSIPGFIYTLRSTIPIGAGLGNSASVYVCLSAALLLQIRTLTGPHPDQPPEEAEAFVGELCVHGDPSGVDNTISTSGKAMIFQRNHSGPSSITPLTKFPKLPLLLVNTQQPRSTATQVEKVKTLKTNHTKITELILDGISQLTTSALELISSADFNGDGISDTLKRLGTLICMKHGSLVSLGVSYPRLERIRKLIDYADIGWTKLTGAGGGGCAITLFRPDVKEETIKELERKFTTEGFQKYETVLGTDGVGVLWPAVFRNSISGEGGKEID